MKVFLSWSGIRSKQIATALRDWLPDVLHSIQPWMSESDITAGQRWSLQIGKTLEDSNFGVLCITPENVSAPWLTFEAGALSKSLIEGAVIPYLFDVQLSEINSGPLGQFQAKKVDREGTFGLVSAMNLRFDTPIQGDRLRRVFDRAWPDLERTIGRVSKSVLGRTPSRSTAEILEELVGAIRSLDRRVGALESYLIATPDEDLVAQLESHVSLDAIRQYADAAVKATSLIAVASASELSTTALWNFIDRGTCSSPAVRRLKKWYVRSMLARTTSLAEQNSVKLKTEVSSGTRLKTINRRSAP